MAHLDVHPVRALVEGDVRRDRHDDVGPRDAARRARLLAVGVQRGDEALRAAARDDADARAVQQVRGHGDDLALELGGARVHVALQHVGVRVQVEDLAEEVVVVVVAAVEAARDGALVAALVLGVRHAGDLGQDGRAVDRLGRHRAVRRRRLAVRVEIADDLRETVVSHLSHLARRMDREAPAIRPPEPTRGIRAQPTAARGGASMSAERAVRRRRTARSACRTARSACRTARSVCRWCRLFAHRPRLRVESQREEARWP